MVESFNDYSPAQTVFAHYRLLLKGCRKGEYGETRARVSSEG